MNTPTYNQYCLQSLDASNTFQHSGESYPAKARNTAMKLFSTLDDLDPTNFNNPIIIHKSIALTKDKCDFIGLYWCGKMLFNRIHIIYKRNDAQDYMALNIYSNKSQKVKMFENIKNSETGKWEKVKKVQILVPSNFTGELNFFTAEELYKKKEGDEPNLISIEKGDGHFTVKAHPLLCLYYAMYIQEEENLRSMKSIIPCKNYGVMIANILLVYMNNTEEIRIKAFISFFLKKTIPLFEQYNKPDIWTHVKDGERDNWMRDQSWKGLPYINSTDKEEEKQKKKNKYANLKQKLLDTYKYTLQELYKVHIPNEGEVWWKRDKKWYSVKPVGGGTKVIDFVYEKFVLTCIISPDLIKNMFENV